MSVERQRAALVCRRFPRWSEIHPLFDLSVRWPTRASALDRCADLEDIRLLARKRVPRMVFDFVDGAAGSESSRDRAREAFSRVEMEPRALTDVKIIDMSIDLLGRKSALPFFFAPTGATRLSHHLGEIGVARVAAELGLVCSVSTLGTTTVEDLAAAVPDARRWFQLYLVSDRARTAQMLERAWTSGFDALILTIDTPVPGRRNRDVRNGLAVPPKLTWRSIAGMVGYPGWWFDKLTTEPFRFAMIDAVSERPEERMARVMDPTVAIRDVEWVRDRWPGKLIVKGIQSVNDAMRLVERKIDAIHVSNHGGRQLDRAPVPFELLPAIREAVEAAGANTQIFVDGGVMSGPDIVACLARGADAVALGRGSLYGLQAGGEAGVRRVATLLRQEMATTMALLGRTSVADLRDVPVTIRAARGNGSDLPQRRGGG
jgi:L-lactate dehydrogenase (cytochrome)